jgi:hypothetical protein
MPDHVHMLLTPMRDATGWPYALPAILKIIKGVSARSVNKLLGSSGPVWQDESFDHVLRSGESFAEKLEYIRQNPLRASLVSRAEEYPWLWVEEQSRSSCGETRVHPAESVAGQSGFESGRISVAMGRGTIKINININIKGSGQECPLHTNTNGKGHAALATWPLFNAGNYLLSHTLSRAVPSAQRGLTSVFGMGTGGTPAVRSPTSRSSGR